MITRLPGYHDVFGAMFYRIRAFMSPKAKGTRQRSDGSFDGTPAYDSENIKREWGY
jgi:hypothetical protein